MSLYINPDIPFFDNTNGKVLSNGTVYFGLPNQDPKTSPATNIYSDAAFTTAISATQSLTAAGKLTQPVYLNGPYSILAENSSGTQIDLTSSVSENTTFSEEVAGSDFDGTNKVTLSSNYTDVTKVLKVFRNGQLLNKGASNDYTETSSNEVTLTFDPNDYDVFRFIFS